MHKMRSPPVVVRHLGHKQVSENESAGKGGGVPGPQQSGNEGGYGQASQQLAQHVRRAEVQHLCDDLETLVLRLQVKN